MKYKVFEAFSGIGAQHSALENLKKKGILDYEIIGTSDWDIYSVLSYASIHCEKELKNMKEPTEKQVIDFLSEHTLSKDGKMPTPPPY